MRLIDWAKQADIEFRANPLNYEDIDFDLPGARIFYVDKNDQLVTHSIHGDIYEGLSLVMNHPIPNCQIIGIETCGWAAPLGPDGTPGDAPSQHPERERVRMLSVINQQFQIASAVIFQSRPDDAMTDEDGEASGSLAEALRRTMAINCLAAAMRERERTENR